MSDPWPISHALHSTRSCGTAELEDRIKDLTQERDRAHAEKKEVRDKLEQERKETARRVERLEKENEELKKKASDVRHCDVHARLTLALRVGHELCVIEARSTVVCPGLIRRFFAAMVCVLSHTRC